MNLKTLRDKIFDGYAVTREEAAALCRLEDKEALYGLADEIRARFHGNRFDTCSILNAKSGRCSEDCKWCSQSVFHRTNADVYPLVDEKTALEAARYNAAKGIGKFSLVTSGKRVEGRLAEQACALYRTLSRETGIELCASMGLVSREVLQMLKASGVTNYHCNLETSPSYFGKLCTTHTIEQKIETLRRAQEAGLKICSGGIIGMGETMDDRIEWAFALRDLDVRSIPLNILNPIPGTKLEGTPPLGDEEILTTFALFRIVNPKAMIRFAGGRLQIAHIQEKALRSGVNAALMGDMLTTSGNGIDEDKEMIARLGYVMQ